MLFFIHLKKYYLGKEKYKKIAGKDREREGRRRVTNQNRL